jgi:hypothetical protein
MRETTQSERERAAKAHVEMMRLYEALAPKAVSSK